MNALLSHIERLRPRIVAGVCVCCLGVIAAREASALQDTTYSSALDDRFSSGYPNTPVNNASASFLGAGYDFSGVGWSSADPTKSFGLLSPRHYLVARHYSGAATLSFFGDDGQVHSYSQQSVEDTNYGIVFSGQTVGDISMGTLTTSVAASNQIQPFSILDLGSYTNQTVMLYGHGPDGSSSPRVGETTISNVTTGIGANLNSYFETPRTQTQLEGGDSGSPAFIPWTDPTGAKQLTIIGNNAGVGTTNYLNFLGRQEVITALNGLMANEGYALRFVADATATWVGGGSGSPSQKNVFSQSSNWSGQAPSATGYLAFDADTTSYLSVSLGSATQNSRGLIFNPGSTGFTLSSGTLSLGRGGINNYDVHRQTFSNGFTLADSQYWDGRSGGLTVTGAVNTNGKLLIVEGSARNSLSGGISGSGSLAKDGSGVLALSGSNNYTGPTFLHNGVLLADNSAGSATGTGFVTVETGTLAGFGVISGSAIVATGAHVTAGDIVSGTVPTLDPALQANNNLTFGGDLTLNGVFDFYLGNLSELSGYTQLILNGAAPLLSLGNASSFTLGTSNFLGVGTPSSGLAFWDNPHAWTLIDVAGSNPILGAFTSVNLGTWTGGSFALAYNTGSGSNNVSLSYTPVNPVPEPATWISLFLASLVLKLARAKRAPVNFQRSSESKVGLVCD